MSMALSGLTQPRLDRALRRRSGLTSLPATATTSVATTVGLSEQAKRPAQAPTTQRSLQSCLFLPHLLRPELHADGGEAGNLKMLATRRGAGHVEHGACGMGQPRHVSLAA